VLIAFSRDLDELPQDSPVTRAVAAEIAESLAGSKLRDRWAALRCHSEGHSEAQTDGHSGPHTRRTSTSTITVPCTNSTASTEQVHAEAVGDKRETAGLDLRDALHRYAQRFEERFNAKPKIERPKDPALIKKMLVQHGRELMLSLIDQFFESSDAWIQKTGYTIGVLSKVQNTLVVELHNARPQPEGPDWFEECRRLHDRACNGSNGHRLQLELDETRKNTPRDETVDG
jgi:hypothetical protein